MKFITTSAVSFCSPNLPTLAQGRWAWSLRSLLLVVPSLFLILGGAKANDPCDALDLGTITMCNGFMVFNNIDVDGEGGTAFSLMGTPCQPLKSGGDVSWIKFSMPAGVNIIRWQLVSSNAAHQLYYSTDGTCNNLDFISCDDDFNSNMFIINPAPGSPTMFYLAVYEDEPGFEENMVNLKLQGCACMDMNFSVSVSSDVSCVNPGGSAQITATGPFEEGTKMGEPNQYTFQLKIGNMTVQEVSGTMESPANSGMATATFTVMPTMETTYTVCYARSDGCLASDDVTIEIGPTVTTVNACESGGTVQFTQMGGTPGGTWSVTGGGTIDPSTGVFTPSTPGCYSANYTLPVGGCDNPEPFVVFPTAPVLSAPANTCAAMFTLPSVTPVAGFDVEWSINGGGYTDSPVIPTTPGCYSITARYVLGSDCGSTSAGSAGTGACGESNIVNVIIFPTAPVIADPVNTCDAAFTLPGVPVVAGFVAEYSINGGPYSTSPAVPATPGCYTITARYVTDANCGTILAGTAGTGLCGPVNTVNVVIFPTAPVITMPAVACMASFTLPVVPIVAGFNTEFSIDGGGFSTSPSLPTTPGCYSIKARYVLAATCGSTAASTAGTGACGESNEVMVAIFPMSPTLTPPANTCNMAFTLPSVPVVGGFDIEYSINGGMFSASPTIPTTPGCHTVTARYVLGSNCGSTLAGTPGMGMCASSNTVSVVIFPEAPTLTPPANTCNAAISLPTVPVVAGFDVEYSINGAAFTSNPSPLNIPGCYSIAARYVLSANCGLTTAGTPGTGLCGPSNTVNAVVFPAAPVLSAPANACNAAFTLPTVSAVAGFDIEYSIDGGGYSGSPSIPATPGCHTVAARYVLAADCGSTLAGTLGTGLCGPSNTVSVVIFPTAPSLTAPMNTCNAAFTLPAVTPISGFNVEYSINGGGYTASPTVPTTPGCHTVSARYVLASDCGATLAGTPGEGMCGESLPVNAIIFPEAPVITPPANACDAAFSLPTVPAVPGFDVEYSINGGGYSTTPAIQTVPGCYSITARYTTNAICNPLLAGEVGTGLCGPSNTVNVVVFPAAPVLSAPANTCDAAFALPGVPAVAGFDIEYSIDGGSYTTTPAVPSSVGCHTVSARYVLSADCGSTLAGTPGAGLCGPSNTVNVVIFPTAPVITPPMNTCDAAFTLPSVTPVAGFDVEYRINGGMYETSPTIPTTPGCYSITARYVLAADCGSISAGTPGTGMCAESNTVNVLIFPNAPVITPPANVCNAAFSLPTVPAVPGFDVEYSINGGGFSTAPTIPTAAGCYAITARYVSSSNCGSILAGTVGTGLCGPSNTVNVVIFPAAPVIAAPANACNAAFSLPVVPAVSGFDVEYSIDGGPYSTAPMVPATPGCYSVTARYALAADCGNTLAGTVGTGLCGPGNTVNVVIFPMAPTLTPPVNTCNTAFALPTVPPVAGFDIEYSIDGGGFAASPVIPATPGCHTVAARYVMGADCGITPAGTPGSGMCGASATVSVVVYPEAPVIAAPMNTCDAAFVLPTVPAVAGFDIEYNINGGGWSASPAIPTTAGCYSITARYVNSANCGATIAGTPGTGLCGESNTVSVVIFPAAPTITPPTNTCNAAFALPTVPAVTGFDVEYSIDGGPWSASPMVPSDPGCYAVQARYALSADCGGTPAGAVGTANCGPGNTVNVVVFPTIPTITPPANTCEAAFTLPVLPAVPGFDVEYSIDGGLFSQMPVIPTTPGCYTVVARYVTAANCGAILAGTPGTGACGASNPVSVVIFPNAPNIAAPANTCNTAFALPVVPPVAGFTAEYSINGGGYSTAPVVPTTPGCHTVTARYVTAVSCGANPAGTAGTGMCGPGNTVNVVIFPAAPVIAPPMNTCEEAFILPDVTPVAGFDVEYNIDGGPWSASPTIPTLPGAYTIEARYVLAADCGATLAGTPGTGACGASNQVMVTIFPNPTLTGDDTVCIGEMITLTGSGTKAPVDPYVSSDPSIATVDDDGKVMGISVGMVTITYTDINGCQDMADVAVIDLMINPIADIGPVCPGEVVPAVMLSSVPNDPAVQYSWTGGAPAGLPDGNTTGMNPEIGSFVAGLVEGTWTVTVTATLGAGPGACVRMETFDIIIDDVDGLRWVNCPADITLNNDVDKCCATVNWTPPVAVDFCTPSGNVVVTGPTGGTSGDCFDVSGSPYTISYTATDGMGNTITCSFTITIIDMQAPDISCPGSGDVVEVFTNNGDCKHTVSGTTLDATASDNCAVTSFTNDYNNMQSLDAAMFPIGETMIEWAAEDAEGNTSTCKYLIRVLDNDAPQATTCPGNISESVDMGTCEATINYTTPVFSDNCDGMGQSGTLISGLPSGSKFPLRKTTVAYIYLDDAGNGPATCSFEIEVLDNEDPTITCPPDLTLNNDVDKCSAVATWTPPTANDNCGTPAIAQIGGPSPGITVDVNTPVVIVYQATDKAGNTAICSFNVSVMDMQMPELTCPGGIQQFNTNNGACTWTVPGTIIDVSVTDNCPGVVLTNDFNNMSSLANEAFVKGSAVVIWTATDAGQNTATCSYTVVVKDNQAPLINCANINPVRTNDQGLCLYTVPDNSLDPIAFSDNCPMAAIANDVNGSATLLGASFPVGTTEVIWTVTDMSGNTTTCKVDVEVIDNEPPTIECPANATVSIEGGTANVIGGPLDVVDCDACGVSMSYDQPLGNDNCPNWSVDLLSGFGAAVNCYGFNGVYTNTYRVTDAAGNTATCSFTVTVGGEPNPVVLVLNGPAEASCGQTIVFDVVVNSGFEDLYGLQFSMNWDPAEMMYAADQSGLTPLVIDGDAPFIGTGNTDAGMLVYSWGSINASPDDVADGTVIFRVRMVLLNSNGAVNLDITGNPAQLEATAAPFFKNIGVEVTNWSVPVLGSGVTAHNTTIGACESANIPNQGEFNLSDADSEVFHGNASGDPVPADFSVSYHTSLQDAENELNALDKAAPYVAPSGNLWARLENTTTGCFAVSIVHLNVLDVPGVTLHTTNAECAGANDGSIEANVTTNAGPWDYAWYSPAVADPGNLISQTFGSNNKFNALIDLSPADYLLVVTDANGCQNNVMTTVLDGPALTITPIPAITVCPGADVQPIELSALPLGLPVQYSWTGGATANLVNGVAGGADPEIPAFTASTTVQTVTVTVTGSFITNNGACTDTEEFILSIEDSGNPLFLNCPGSIVVQNDVDKCGAVVQWNNLIALDGCDSMPLAVSQTLGDPSGSFFPVSATPYTIQFQAEDNSGNTITCSFTVTVTDMQTPKAVCKDTVIDLPATAPVSVSVLAANIDGGSSDNCALASLDISTSTFDCSNVGDNNVTLTVTDSVGNSSICVAEVTVRDVTAPIFTCPAPVTVSSCNNVVPDLISDIMDEEDNCTAVTLAQSLPAGTAFGLVNGGTVNITITATDAHGNVSSCEVPVTITDGTDPVVICPADITVGNDVDKCGANVTYSIPTVTDDCPNVTVALSDGLLSGAFFPVGETTVEYIGTDAGGNTSTCAFTVEVMDMQTPTAVCQDVVVDLNADGEATITPSMLDGGSTDNCPATLTLAASATDFDCSNVGENNVTLTVTDGAGNESVCVSEVTVRDVTAPVFDCPDAVTVASCSALVPDVIDGLTATDACGVASITQDPAAGLDFGAQSGNGVVITVTVTDVNGNASTCEVPVTIDDSTNPVFLNCPTSMIMIGNDPDQCAGKVNWQPPVAVDDCLQMPISAPGAPVPGTVTQTGGPLPGTFVAITCPATAQTVTYQATDAQGNTSVCSFEVMVVDTEKPEFDADVVMPGNVTVECDAVPAPFVLTNDDVNDNCTAPADMNILYTQVSTQGTNPALCSFYNYTLTRTWRVTDCAGNALVHTQVITVEDTTAPEAKCKNLTVALDKFGLATITPDQINNGSTDNCAAPQFLTYTVDPDSFTCANLGANTVTLTVTDPCGNSSTCTAVVTVVEGIGKCVPEFDLNRSLLSQCLDNATNLDNGQFEDRLQIHALAGQTWTIAGSVGFYTTTSPNPPAAPIPLANGTTLVMGNLDGVNNDGDGLVDEADEMVFYTLRGRHIDGLGYSITVTNNLGQLITITNKSYYPTPIFLNLDGPFCLSTPPFQIQVGENNGAAGVVTEILVNGVPTNTFNAAQLGIGFHTVKATFDAGTAKPFVTVNGAVMSGSDTAALADPGCAQMITQTVQVVGTPTTIVCNDLVYISLDTSCRYELNADDVLEGTYFCYDDYTVQIDRILPLGNGPWEPGIVTAADIGKTLAYRVVHQIKGNLCWGEIKVEDKLAPALTCPADITVACSESTDTAHTGNIVIKDCSTTTVQVDDEFTDFGKCADPKGELVRTWIVTDKWGNQSSCSQTITIAPFDLDDVTFPADVNVDCEEANSNPDATLPDATGVPTINGESVIGSVLCNAKVNYTDEYFDGCEGMYVILRTWKVLSACMPVGPDNPRQHTQRINVNDSTGPQFDCPDDLTVSTNPGTCCATAPLPSVIVSEGCSRIVSLSAKVTGMDQYSGNFVTFTVPGSLADFAGNNYWIPDTLAVFGTTQCLARGVYTVRYTAEDACGNVSVCEFELTVEDLVPPVAVCDEFTQVSLGSDGKILVNATTFDDGSYDQCDLVTFKVRLMDDGPCDTDTLPDLFDDTVPFCCADIGDTVTVILRVYDVAMPNGKVAIDTAEERANDCMVRVFIEDKIKPVCVPPAHVTVSCENFDPSFWAHGANATGMDNCCLDTITQSVNYGQFDTICNRGTIIRTFRAQDCFGLSSQCTQRIVVNDKQDYYIKFPDDVLITFCDSTGMYGQPTFFGEDCELIAMSHQDDIFTVVPDACFKIERTWRIINWCTYNPNQPCVTVPNPEPNAMINAAANRPGPTVSPAGTPAPWNPTVVSIQPGQAPTNYSTFWSTTANCFTYKQIIKVIDTQDPVVTNCPASPFVVDDLSENDDEFYNSTNFYDPVTESKDLCEAEAELTITAGDACSKSDLRFSYLLFLDMNQDGTMETVVSSNNPPPFNTINVGNANNPNYTGGTPVAFDQRPVPASQKFRFNIDVVRSGTTATAKVIWDWQQQQANLNDNILQGVTPQLPYGKHKIKWFVSDNCGNESSCEYLIEVKDGKPPTVICYNGLSVNIMPTKMISLTLADFLKFSEDNCTPEDKLVFSMRRAGTGSGFPVDAQGNPITSVLFDCSMLDTQYVEIWAMDLAGNADFCKGFVDVQDPNNFCGPTPTNASVAGALTTELDEGVQDAYVELEGQTPQGATFSYTDVTDQNGAFSFTNMVPYLSNYMVTPAKDDNPLNGVSTYDLVLISRHILGLDPLDSPYKMIAADANKSGSITTFDIVELRKLILGIYTELPNNTSWRFVDQSFVFPNLNNPFTTLFPETKSVGSVVGSNLAANFVGVKVGDVNGSVLPNNLVSVDDRTGGQFFIDAQDRTVAAGEEFTVQFSTADKALGYQFTMNLKGLEVVNVLPGERMTKDNFGVFADAITASVNGDEMGAFAVTFRALHGGRLSELLSASSRITRAEAYTLNAERLDVAFRFDGQTVSGVGFEVYQNIPNPWLNKTQIGFHLPEAAEVTLTVFDETGQMLFRQTSDFGTGYNAFVLDRSLISKTGALYYRVETATDSAVKTMIQTK